MSLWGNPLCRFAKTCYICIVVHTEKIGRKKSQLTNLLYICNEKQKEEAYEKDDGIISRCTVDD